MFGIRNPRTARATNDLRINAGGYFLFVIVMWYHTWGSYDRGIKMADPGSSQKPTFNLIWFDLFALLFDWYIYSYLGHFF